MNPSPEHPVFSLILHGTASKSRVAPSEFSITFIAAEGNLFATLSAARALGSTHAVVVRGDDPLDRGELPALLNAVKENPAALFLGSRCASTSGDWLSHLLLRLETGLRLSDLHGPRVYPLRLIDVVSRQPRRRMDELELLVRAAWAGCPIVEVKLPVQPAASVREQPLRPNPHKLRTVLMHTRLMARALSGMRHPPYDPSAVRPPRKPFWPTFWRWLNPFVAWRKLRQGGISRNEMAIGLGIGAFIGNMPVWGFQAVISLYVARRLHLNPLAVMTGSHVSAPPMGPLLIAAAMWTGHVILHRAPPRWENMTLSHGKFFANALPILLDWTVGGILIGITLAIIVFLVANFLFRFIEKENAGSRHRRSSE